MVTLNYAADDQPAAAALAKCRETGPDAVLVKGDGGAAAEAEALVCEAIGAFGRLDVLVNNSALVIEKPALDMTEDDWGL
jgi:3-oxoacyl-[acyl-carrier protein] reductase